jgi:hypothetical protein
MSKARVAERLADLIAGALSAPAGAEREPERVGAEHG